MDYGAVARDAMLIAWHKRYLWPFGFFVSTMWTNLSDLITSDRLVESLGWFGSDPSRLEITILLGSSALVLVTVLQIVASGGLISGVGDIERKRSGDLEAALASGIDYFWRILGLNIIFLAVLLLLMMILILPFIVMILGSGSSGKVAGIVWLMVMALPVLLALFWTSLFWEYGMRFLVLEDGKIFGSLAKSWRLMKRRPAESLMLLIVSLGLRLAIAIGLTFVIAILKFSLVTIAMLSKPLGLALGLALGVPCFALASCLCGVFGSAYWTLGFLRLRSSVVL